jgi:cytosine/adenosine deaminase-related metal-dependent hydrolase
MASYDIVIENAYILERNDVVDIAIADGRIAEISGKLSVADADRVIDAGGNFVSPGLIDCHMHIDKSFAAEGERFPKGNDDTFRFDRIAEQERTYFDESTVDQIRENAIRDIEMAVVAGSTYLRSHISVDTDVRGIDNMRAAVDARERTSAIADLQLVPGGRDDLTQEGQAVLHEAVEMGSDASIPNPVLVGGSDPASRNNDIERSLENWFQIADEHDVELDLHVHDGGTLGVYTLERILAHMRRSDYRGRVTASHSYALAHIPEWRVKEVLTEAADCGLKFVTCYQSTRTEMPVRTMLMMKDVVLGHGTDNDRDFVFAQGSADSVQAMFVELNKLHGDRTFAEEYRWFESNEGLAALWDMITYQGARVLGIEDEYGIEEGNPGNLVVFDKPSPQWAIISDVTREYVIKDGVVVARNGELVPEHRVSN